MEPFGAGEHHEALAACATDERKPAFRASSTPQAVKPERETRAGNAHPHGLDDHFGGEATGGVKRSCSPATGCAGACSPRSCRPRYAGRHPRDRSVADPPPQARNHGWRPPRDRAKGLVDLAGERIEPGGANFCFRQGGVLDDIHEVAEHGALRAAGSLNPLLSFSSKFVSPSVRRRLTTPRSSS